MTRDRMEGQLLTSLSGDHRGETRLTTAGTTGLPNVITPPSQRHPLAQCNQPSLLYPISSR